MLSVRCFFGIKETSSPLHTLFRLAQAMREIGQELFLAGDDVAQFVDAGFEARVVDALDELFVANGQQQ